MVIRAGIPGFQAATEWAPPADSWPALDQLGAAAFLVLFLGLVVRAWLTQGRERATSALDEEDRARLRAALAAAERRTSGEILPVVLGRSDAHPSACWRAGLVLLVAGTLLLAGRLPWEHPTWLLALQLAFFALGHGTARALPGFQRLFLTRRRAAEMVSEQALQEFHRHGLFETRGRTGVLLFVSLLERQAVVLGDVGIDARVGAEAWEHTTRTILDGIRRESLRAGLEAGIQAAADVLATHFPRAANDTDEIPDRIVVRAE